MRSAAACVVVLTLLVPTSSAQQACPCVPISHEWIVTACSSWECASEIVSSSERRTVVPMPTASSDYTWVVLRRVPTGSAIISPDAPYKVDGFDSLPVASAHFAAIHGDLNPILVTAPDGRILLVARTSPELRRRRISSH